MENQVRNQGIGQVDLKEKLKELIFELTGQQPELDEGEIQTNFEMFRETLFYLVDDNPYIVNRIYDSLSPHGRRYTLASKRGDIIIIEFQFKPLSDKVIVTKVKYRFVN